MNESGDKSTVRCKTKGQPLVFKKVTVPRKPSWSAASPTRSKRASVTENIRPEVSGSTAEDETKQHNTEIKKSMQRKKKEKKKGGGGRIIRSSRRETT